MAATPERMLGTTEGAGGAVTVQPATDGAFTSGVPAQLRTCTVTRTGTPSGTVVRSARALTCAVATAGKARGSTQSKAVTRGIIATSEVDRTRARRSREPSGTWSVGPARLAGPTNHAGRRVGPGRRGAASGPGVGPGYPGSFSSPFASAQPPGARRRPSAP